MFRRTICAMTAWAGLAGFANAQGPTIELIRGETVIPEPDLGPWVPRPGTQPPDQPPSQPTPPRVGRLSRPIPIGAPLARQTDPPRQPGTGTSPSDAPPTPKSTTSAGPAVAANPDEQGYVAAPGRQPIFPRAGHTPGAPSGRVWTRVEWLVWSTSGQHMPPAITSSNFLVPANFAGVLPSPNTTTVFPLDRTNNEYRGGFRLNFGYWFDNSQSLGVEGDFFFVGNSKKGITLASESPGDPILARPFTNAITGEPSSVLVAYPGLSRGAIEAHAQSHAIGGGVNALYDLIASPCDRLDLVVGYRYLGVFDEVVIESDATALSAQPGVPFATRSQVMDSFKTTNNFNGGLIGLNAEHKFGYWFVGGRATIALGGVEQIVQIDGRNVVTQPNGIATATYQGLYAQASNNGRYDHVRFAIVPELNLRAGVQMTESARFYVGYNWMYLSSVVRAGDQIDLHVNPNFLPQSTGLVPGPHLPTFQGTRTDYWLQGVSFGMEIKF